MRRDFIPEGKPPDPAGPRHARDYYPEGTAPRGLGQRVRTDYVPEGGLKPLPEEEGPATAMLPEPKEAPLLAHDFVPSIPLEPEPTPRLARLPLGTRVVRAADGRRLVITGYDEDGQLVAEVEEEGGDDPTGRRGDGETGGLRDGERGGRPEAGAKGGESLLDEPRRSLAFPSAGDEADPAPSTQHPAPKKSHKKKTEADGDP